MEIKHKEDDALFIRLMKLQAQYIWSMNEEEIMDFIKKALDKQNIKYNDESIREAINQ